MNDNHRITATVKVICDVVFEEEASAMYKSRDYYDIIDSDEVEIISVEKAEPMG